MIAYEDTIYDSYGYIHLLPIMLFTVLLIAKKIRTGLPGLFLSQQKKQFKIKKGGALSMARIEHVIT